jgi:hypothetical protein
MGNDAMKPSIRIFAVLFLAGFAAACAGTGPANPEHTLRKRIGNAYGAPDFYQVDALRYTFNAQIGARTVQRTWVWEPKTDRVVLRSSDEGADYERKRAAASDELRSVDARFINDNYWFLFPLHVFWDTEASLMDTGLAELPIGPGRGRRVLVSYPSGKRYNAGDIYEIFLDTDFRIVEWIYRKKGAVEPTRVTTWESDKALGPLTVSLMHRSKHGEFRLWFTDVGVKLIGDNHWTEPE